MSIPSLPPPSRDLDQILTEIEALLAELRSLYEAESDAGDGN
jgi:hypothetical protein